MDDAEIVERLLADQRLLRLPLVRRGNEVSAGPAEATWKGWLAGGTPDRPPIDAGTRASGRRNVSQAR